MPVYGGAWYGYPRYYACRPENDFLPDPDEIETLIEVPLSHLRDPFYRRIDEREVFGHRIPVYYYQYQGFTIWGVTGQLIFDFLNVLDA